MPGTFDAVQVARFFEACENEDTKKLEELLELDPLLVVCTNEKGATALMVAAVKGSVALIDFLLKKGAYINTEGVRESTGMTALWLAAWHEQWTAVDALLERGAGVHASPKVGSNKNVTVLLLAALANRWDLVKRLIEKDGVDLNTCYLEGENKGVTVLWLAANHEQWDLVESLIEKSVRDLDAFPITGDENGLSVLWYAALFEKWEIVKKLLERGAKKLDAAPLTGFNKGFTALLMAGVKKQWNIVRLILQKKAETLLEGEKMGGLCASMVRGGEQGLTVLWYAAHDRQWDIVRLLIGFGAADFASCSTIPGHEVPILWYAVESEQWDLVKVILKKRVSDLEACPTVGLQKNVTVLRWSVESGNDEIFRLLLTQGASLELANNHKVNLISLALNLAEQISQRPDRSGEIMITFIAAKTIFDLAGNTRKLTNEELAIALSKNLDILGPALNGKVKGKTALHIALAQDNKPAIEALVLTGADLLLADEEGRTAELLSPLPLIQAFAKLQFLKGELEALQAIQNEPDVFGTRAGRVAAIPQLVNTLFSLGSKLTKPEHKSKFYYKLGEMLEGTHPDFIGHIKESMILEAFSKVPEESEALHRLALAKVVHYKAVIPRVTGPMVFPKNSRVESLDEDELASLEIKQGSEQAISKQESISRAVAVLTAGQAIETSWLSRLVPNAILGSISEEEQWGLIRKEDSYQTSLEKTLLFVRTKVDGYKEQVEGLRGCLVEVRETLRTRDKARLDPSSSSDTLPETGSDSSDIRRPPRIKRRFSITASEEDALMPVFSEDEDQSGSACISERSPIKDNHKKPKSARGEEGSSQKSELTSISSSSETEPLLTAFVAKRKASQRKSSSSSSAKAARPRCYRVIFPDA